MSDTADRERLTRLYDEYARRVYGYALRRCGPADADDVVAEVFAVAWRRRDDLPEEPFAWLLVTARHVIADWKRAAARRVRLVEVVGSQPAVDLPGVDEEVVQRRLMLAALDTLSAREREALLLVAWDGLNNEQAALVAGCSARAFRARMTRARAHLETALLTQTTQQAARTLTEGTPT